MHVADAVMLDGNPYHSPLSIANSSYLGMINGTLVNVSQTRPLSVRERHINAALHSFILQDNHPCLGARAALNKETYRFGAYRDMASHDTTAGLAHDLFRFTDEHQRLDNQFTTFIAVFDTIRNQTESSFEALLWNQLQRLHDIDTMDYDVRVAADPMDPQFAFSFAGCAFFVVGMHPYSSRFSRRFSWPALVFNPRSQFDLLRSKGRFEGFAQSVRQREIALQGSINPNLDEPWVGRSEARQYSGRAVAGEWRCPFRP